ncbi:hypothetical protein BRC62_02120 [Halobacteriales archaeon QH_10_67_13]|nr:MAG: hypothetical protein BRC62_02120 [Halobacteriales archaeon QH_10_67_13]
MVDPRAGISRVDQFRIQTAGSTRIGSLETPRCRTGRGTTRTVDRTRADRAGSVGRLAGAGRGLAVGV